MTQSKTIRLVMPQWQGGDNPLYHLGAELLDYFAPSTKTPSFTVPVTKPGMPLKNENGITGRGEIVKQLQSAYAIINREKPDKNCYVRRRLSGRSGAIFISEHGLWSIVRYIVD